MSRVQVKPLEWIEAGGQWYASGYRIKKYDDDLYIVYGAGCCVVENPHDSLDTAKAAAQSRHEFSVLNALVNDGQWASRKDVEDMTADPMSDADILRYAEAIEARGWHPDHSQNQLARALRELIARRALIVTEAP